MTTDGSSLKPIDELLLRKSLFVVVAFSILSQASKCEAACLDGDCDHDSHEDLDSVSTTTVPSTNCAIVEFEVILGSASFFEEETPGDPDGRRSRRERNRLLVVDGLLNLYSNGNLRPSVLEIGIASGVSGRSIFRYFSDTDDLVRSAIARAIYRSLPLLEVKLNADATLNDRVGALIDQRITLFSAISPVAMVARLNAPFQPILQEEISRNRRFLRHQIARILGDFLPSSESMDSNMTLLAIDVLSSFEAYCLMVNDQNLSMAQIRDCLFDAIMGIIRQSEYASKGSHGQGSLNRKEE